MGSGELGYTCPQDLAIVAFTDYAWCEVTHPPLTCVRQLVREIGEAAADLFLRGRRGELPAPAPSLVLPVSLIIRQSCGCARTSARGTPTTRRSI